MILCSRCDGSCHITYNGFICNRCHSVYSHCECIEKNLEEKECESIYDCCTEDENLVLPNTHKVIGWTVEKRYLPEDFNLEESKISDIPEKFISYFNYVTENHVLFAGNYKPQMEDDFEYYVLPSTSWVVHCRECEEIHNIEF